MSDRARRKLAGCSHGMRQRFKLAQALVHDPGNLTGWSGPYVRDAKALSDPWNDPLIYKLNPDGRSFYVESLGADGKPGGTALNRDLKAPAEP